MCGITGKVFFSKGRNISDVEIKNMTDTIIHRGPNDSGIYTDKNIGLGFRRLSIIDLHTGHQPLSNEDDSIWIVFNGEIYNFMELRQTLVSKGHRFKTKTDTEVIIHLYEEFGVDCVKQLRGMFAFVIWDSKKQQIFCARDRFGIKPFYYFIDNEKFIFGSEIKSIKASNDINFQLNIFALDAYFTYGYTIGEQTIFEGIKKLRPSHTLLLKLNENFPKPIISRYWQINFDTDYSKTEEDWCKEIQNVLSESVKMHLVSDVPIGAFLSGGIDSSSVVALMAKNVTGRIKTFSIGFKEQDFSELDFAKSVAEKYETEHFEKIVEPDCVSLLPKLVKAYDEPFADSSAIPTYYVSEFARQNVTVALSGDGGDELCAGYTSYPKFQKIGKYNLPLENFNKMFWGTLFNAIPEKVKGKGITYFLSKDRDEAQAYLGIFKLYERSSLFNEDVWNNAKKFPSEHFKVNLLRQSSSKDLLGRLQEMDLTSYMVDDILTKVDIASMQNSLEVRVPILDHKVAELFFKIPSDLRLKGDVGKYILKKSMNKYLPEKVLNHKKQGFALPFKLWFKKDLKDYTYDKLCDKNSKISNYLNINFLRKILNDHNSGMRDFNQKIWSVLFFAEWLEQNN